jgi:hypothetical protein
MIDNLVNLGALRAGLTTAAVGPGHLILYTENGPLDVIVDDLIKAAK